MSLRETLSNYWYAFQQELFPRLEATLAPLSPRYELFVEVVEFVRLEDLLPYLCGPTGAPPRGSRGAGSRLPCQGGLRHPDKHAP